MLRVQIDYRRNDPTAAWGSVQLSWSQRLLSIVIASVMLQLYLLPLLAWFIWEQRWLTFSVYEVFMLGWAAILQWNVRRDGVAQLQRMQPMQLTIQPAGLEEHGEQGLHVLQSWRMFHTVRRTPTAMMLMFTDHGKSLGYFIPRYCFATPADADAFADAAEQAIAQRETAPSLEETTLLATPTHEQYRLHYQLTNAELHAEDAKQELLKLYPETLPQTNDTPPKKSINWKFYLAMGLLLVLYRFEDELIPVRHSEYNLVLLAVGFVYLKLFATISTRVQAWWRAAKKSAAPVVEVQLGGDGIFRRSTNELLEIPWGDVDNLLLHQGRLLLWKRDSCRLIIPQRAFVSPEQAHECERWIQGLLQKRFNSLAVAELAEPEPAITLPEPRPASNNPYQAPQV